MLARVARVVVVNDNGSSSVCQRAGLALGNAFCVLALAGAKSLPFFEAVIWVCKDKVTIFQTLQGILKPIIPPFVLIRARAFLKIQPATPEHCCVWKQVRLFDLGYAAFSRIDYVSQCIDRDNLYAFRRCSPRRETDTMRRQACDHTIAPEAG